MLSPEPSTVVEDEEQLCRGWLEKSWCGSFQHLKKKTRKPKSFTKAHSLPCVCIYPNPQLPLMFFALCTSCLCLNLVVKSVKRSSAFSSALAISSAPALAMYSEFQTVQILPSMIQTFSPLNTDMEMKRILSPCAARLPFFSLCLLVDCLPPSKCKFPEVPSELVVTCLFFQRHCAFCE